MNPVVCRRAVEACGLRLDGSPAAPSTSARKRSALYSCLDFAVELGRLPSNPMTLIKVKRTVNQEVVDRRVVVNPEQARALLAAVREVYPSLEAFFGCLYYAGLRPSEARHLRETDLTLPGSGWGELTLRGSTQAGGAAWTDSGSTDEDRSLKHRVSTHVRLVPAHPELVALLRAHLETFACSPDARLFVARTGIAGRPLPAPFLKPLAMGTAYRVWKMAREQALTPKQVSSPLARRPYDLRHACVSTWLNAGVPATQVAEWAGHSVNVLLRVYAKCVYGQEEAAKLRIEAVLAASGTAAKTT
jgi:integrase